MAKYSRWISPEGLTLLEGWAMDGLTDEQIAHNMGINVSTLYRWKSLHKEICEVLKKGKAVIDYEVENALLKRALGYEYVETEVIEGPDGERSLKTTIKHEPPNVVAQIFWLKNRRPDRWRDKPREQQDEQGQETGVVILVPVDDPVDEPE